MELQIPFLTQRRQQILFYFSQPTFVFFLFCPNINWGPLITINSFVLILLIHQFLNVTRGLIRLYTAIHFLILPISIQVLKLRMFPSPERLSIIGDIAILFLLEPGLLKNLYFAFAQGLSSHNITIFQPVCILDCDLSGQLHLRSRPIIKHFVYLLK